MTAEELSELQAKVACSECHSPVTIDQLTRPDRVHPCTEVVAVCERCRTCKTVYLYEEVMRMAMGNWLDAVAALLRRSEVSHAVVKP